MKHILLLLFLSVSFALTARVFKVNYKGTVMPFEVKIERITVRGNSTIVEGKIKQKSNFSYQMTFEGCNIVMCDGDTITGELRNLDGNSVDEFTHTIGDGADEAFVIVFPVIDFDKCEDFSITLGYIKNQKQTPLTFENVRINKKK